MSWTKTVARFLLIAGMNAGLAMTYDDAIEKEQQLMHDWLILQLGVDPCKKEKVVPIK